MHRLNESAIDDIQQFEQGLRDAVRVAGNKYQRYQLFQRAAAGVLASALLVLLVGVGVLRRWTALETGATLAVLAAAAVLAARDRPHDDPPTHTWRINQALRDFNVHYSLESAGLFQVAPFRARAHAASGVSPVPAPVTAAATVAVAAPSPDAAGALEARTPLCPGRYTETEVCS